MSKPTSSSTSKPPAARPAEAAEPQATIVYRHKRPLLLAITALALVAWLGFLAYLAWRG